MDEEEELEDQFPRYEQNPIEIASYSIDHLDEEAADIVEETDDFPADNLFTRRISRNPSLLPPTSYASRGRVGSIRASRMLEDEGDSSDGSVPGTTARRGGSRRGSVISHFTRRGSAMTVMDEDEQMILKKVAEKHEEEKFSQEKSEDQDFTKSNGLKDSKERPKKPVPVAKKVCGFNDKNKFMRYSHFLLSFNEKRFTQILLSFLGRYFC